MCLLVPLAVASCSARDAVVPAEAPRVSIGPVDVLTNTGATPLTILVDGRGRSVPLANAPGALDAVAAAIQLRTYPELSPVAATMAIGPPTDGTAPRSIVVTPAAVLQPRWYVLSVTTLPDGVVPLSDLRLYGTSLGAVASRFNTASAPVLRKLQISEKNLVLVHFSEGVNVDGAGSYISIRDTAGICPFTPVGDSRQLVEKAAFQCSSVWNDARVHFELRPGLQSATGTALGILHTAAGSSSAVVGAGELAIDIDVSSLIAESGVRTWVPEIL